MVAIVSGHSLGLGLTSLATLGSAAPLPDAAARHGRSGERVHVNAATGNLVLQQVDEQLVARGLDLPSVRTYNSLGRVEDGDGEHWSVGVFGQRLQWHGPAGDPASTAVRTDRDGAQARYIWDAARRCHVSSDGAGAFDTIAFDGTNRQWAWTDGDTGLVEHYQADGDGRLLVATDPEGLAVRLGYDAEGRVLSLTDASGGVTWYERDGARLARIRVTAADGAALTTVRYSHDAQGRLETVSVDLSPEDGSVADGHHYLTRYSYDGTSERLAAVEQSDGTRLSFGYASVGGDMRLASVTDALGATTRFSYDLATRSTMVTDPLGARSIHTHDAQGRLVQLRQGVSSANPDGLSRTDYGYDAQGNLVRIVDGEGHAVEFTHDAQGRVLSQRDAAGGVRLITWGEGGQWLTDTVHAGGGQAQPETARQVFAASRPRQLRFEISASGRVTEHRYDAWGQCVSTILYAARTFDLRGLEPGTALGERALAAWAAAQDPGTTQRIDRAYDARGQLAAVTTYAVIDADGQGLPAGAATTRSVHDAHGRLLQQIGPATAGSPGAATSYAYDGLGRLLCITGPSLDGGATANTTLTRYDDAGGRVTVAQSGGLVSTSVYDRAGRLLAQGASTVGEGMLGTERRSYDAAGRLLMIEDPTGARQWTLYDAAGRQVAAIDATGALTESVLDADGRLRQTIAYGQRIDTARLVDADGRPQTGWHDGIAPQASLAALRPDASADDRKTWHFHDAAGRPAWEVDGLGHVTQTRYDAASRVTAVVQWANAIDIGLLRTDTRVERLVKADPARDRELSTLHDADGRTIARIDAEGYLTEIQYDAAGREVQRVAHANRAAGMGTPARRASAIASARATGTLAGLRPAASAADIVQRNFHDARGLLIGQIDGEGYLTEHTLDARGQVVRSVRHAVATSPPWGATLAAVRPAASTQDRVESQTWSEAGQLLSRTNAEGTVSTFDYDAAGRLVRTVTAAGTAEARTRLRRHDAQGRLLAELDGEGSQALAAIAPQHDPLGAQLALWSGLGLTHAYDNAGRRTSTTDANGQRTFYVHDAAGRLAFTVNAMGEVTESRYNAQGQLAEHIVYGRRLDAALLHTPGGLDTAGLAQRMAALADPALDTRVQHRYNADGTEAARTDALGHTTRYGHNAFGELSATTTTRRDGRTVTDTLERDRRGLVTVSVRDAGALALTERFAHDAFGRLLAHFDANGNKQQQAWDRLGRVTATSTDAMQGLRLTTYDAFGRVLTQRDALGARTTYSYDSAARTVTLATLEGVSLATAYDRHGQAVRITDALGRQTTHVYDLDGRLVRTVDAAGNTATASHDRTGQLLESTDALGTVIRLTYDAAGRVLSRTVDPGGLALTTTYVYDAKGQAIQVTDPAGTATRIDFDLAGRSVRQTVDPDGLALATTWAHDSDGSLLRVTAPNGETTQYRYDGAGRRVAEQLDPEGLNLTRRYEYDAAGNLTRAIDANGQATRHAYDGENRRVFTLDAEGGLIREDYDRESRPVRRTVYAAPIDTRGLGNAPGVAQLLARIVASPGADQRQTLRYDHDGRLRFVVDGTGAVTEHRYDRASRLVETRRYAHRIDIAAWDITRNPQPVADPERDQRSRTVHDRLGQPVWQVEGNGAVTRSEYDAAGQVVRRVAYATPLSPAALAAWNGTGAPPVQADPARDQVQRTTYDAAGRAVWQVDGIGAVTRTNHDANGRVTASRAYAQALTPEALAAWDGKGEPAVRLDDGHDAQQRMRYDAAGRLCWQIDGTGAVQHMAHDASGRLTHRVAYARTVPPATALVDLEATVVASGSDRITGWAYDGAGRLRHQIDAIDTDAAGQPRGAVQAWVRDGNGQVLSHTRHAQAVALRGIDPAPAPDAADRITRHAYDAAGRPRWTVDAEGGVTRHAHDGTGAETLTVQYAVALSAWAGAGAQAADPAAPLDAAVLERAQPSQADDRITLHLHDATGRESFTVDTLGGVQRSEYDSFGNLARRTLYAQPVAAPDAATRWTAAQLQAALRPDDAADRADLWLHDRANHQVLHVDALGGATLTERDALGQAVRTRAHARPVDPARLRPGMSPQALDLSGLADDQGDRVQRQGFDAAGHLVRSEDPVGGVTLHTRDALGQLLGESLNGAQTVEHTYDAAGHRLSTSRHDQGTQRWTYDALGNTASHTNALDATWTYACDRMGRVVLETSPEVELAAVRLDGATLRRDPEHSGLGRIRTQLRYDSFGDLRERIEALGRPEQRATQYGHDRLGRQITVTHPAVEVDGVLRTLGTRTVYDALGNAVANTDIGGHLHLRSYDRLGRLRHEVDPLGQVTRHTLDRFGNEVALVRHAQAIAAPSAPDAADPFPRNAQAIDAALAALDASHDRTVHTRFDRLGRAIEVRQDATFVHDGGDGRAGDRVAAATTRYTYDLLGQRVQVARQAGPGRWLVESHIFDPAGREIATVDAMGHLTQRRFDAAGNVVFLRDAVQQAHGASGEPWQGEQDLADWTGLATGAQPSAPVADEDEDDRNSYYEYDSAGRLYRETRGFQYVAPTRYAPYGYVGNVFYYDALGQLARSTHDIDGENRYCYDALGRLRASDEAGKPRTRYQRDALGNVVATVEVEAEADGGRYGWIDAPLLDPAGAADPSSPEGGDHETLARHDAFGHVLQVHDAVGGEHHTRYNAQGLVAREWQTVTRADGSVEEISHVNVYDATGRLISSTEAGSQTDAVTTTQAYNAFGELVRRGVDGDDAEYFEYDNAGQLWRTNTGDGAHRIYLHDQLGRQTAELRSAGAGHGDQDLRDFVDAQHAAARQDLRRTDWQYDALGHLAAEWGPARRVQHTEGAAIERPVVYSIHDRWGGLVQLSDPREAGWVTRHAYDDYGRLLKKWLPAADGSASDAPRVEISYPHRDYGHYDRTVGVIDRGAHRAYWLGSDGRVSQYTYDAFGNPSAGDLGERAYDRLNRLIRVTRERPHRWDEPRPAPVVETQTWDAASRLTSQTNGAGETIRYDHDARGNIVATVLPMGQTTRAAYDARNRKVSETDANGAVATWRYDAFGLLLERTDIGGTTYRYTYDHARQLIAQTSSAGQDLRYRHDAAGQLVGISDNSLHDFKGGAVSGPQTEYGYDLAGHRILEITDQGSVGYQYNRMSYDARGQLRTVSDGRASMEIDYDDAGNRTHVHTTIDDGHGLVSDTHRHYQYDDANRMTVVDAVDANGTLGAGSHRLSYDLKGNRESDTYWGAKLVWDPAAGQDGQPNIGVGTAYVPGSQPAGQPAGSVTVPLDGQTPGTGPGAWVAVAGWIQERYTYDWQNRLVDTVRDGVLVDSRAYDDAGRLIRATPGPLSQDYIDLHRTWAPTNGQAPLAGRTCLYDANGRLISETLDEYGAARTVTTYTHDAAGNVLTSLSANVTDGILTRTINTIERADGYVLTHTLSTASGEDGPISQGGQGYHHDANGHLTFIGDAGQQSADQRLHYFVNDAQGRVLYDFYSLDPQRDIEAHGARQWVVNGEVFGRYGELEAPGTRGLGPDGSTVFYQGSDLSLGYAPITPGHPGATPTAYSVAAGDTLPGIARAAYGDASLWHLVAEANGLIGGEALQPGRVLRIPPHVGSANDANTYKPYDPSRAAGDTPTMMALPQHHGGCGGLGQILVAVVAVVASLWTAGAAAGALGYSAGSTLGTGMAALGGTYGTGIAIGAGIAGGVAGAFASQGAAMAMGMQERFNWKGVVLGALSGGIAGGVGASGIANVGDSAFVNGVVRGGLNSVLTQGLAVATGLQPAFSWRGVAASAVGAGVGAAVGPELGNSFGGRLATGLIAGTAAAVMRGGRIAVQQVVTDAFGNALGSSLASASSGLQTAPAQLDDPLGDFVAKNEAAWDQRYANYQQVLGAFNNQGSNSRQPEVQLAFNGNGRELGGVNFSGDRLPSMYPDPQVIGRGRTAQSLPYEDWDTGATATGVPPQSNLVGQPLASIDGTGDLYRPPARGPGRTMPMPQLDIMGNPTGASMNVPVPDNVLLPGENVKGNVFFGGAGMDGPYIKDTVRAFEKQGIVLTPANREIYSNSTLPDATVGVQITRFDQLPYVPLLDNVPQVGGSQFNLLGYSYGSNVAAQVAFTYARGGTPVDNLVLIGSPIGDDYLKTLRAEPNIRNIIVVDLTDKGDPISAGMSNMNLVRSIGTLAQQMPKSTGHFYYNAPSDAIGQARRDSLAEYLYQRGLR